MKLPFLYKNNSSSPSNASSCSSSSSSPSSWPWPSCHQNPKTLSFRNTITTENPNLIDETEFAPATFSAAAASSSAAAEPPEETESIENVIKGLKSSKRLIFEQKGESKSILEEANISKNGFVLLSLESKDPYSDFKRSMEEMVDTHKLHQDWGSLEKLLYWFLKVNGKSSHGYIFAAFVDLLVGLALKGQSDVVSSSSNDTVTVTVTTETSSTSCSCSNEEVNTNLAGESPSSTLSFYTSCSSDSDETSPSLVPRVTDNESRVCSLSSLLEMEENIEAIDVDGYVSG